MYKQEEKRLFPLICTFVQLFLSVRVFSSCLYICSIVFICTSVSSSYKRKTHAQIKTIEQMYKQEDNTRTDKNNWTRYIQEENTRTDKNKRTKAQTRGKLVHLFNWFYLYVCFPLVCTFVQLFLSVRLSSSCLYLCSIVFIYLDVISSTNSTEYWMN
jgi:uncharacterized membrane protein (DUF485 family)